MKQEPDWSVFTFEDEKGKYKHLPGGEKHYLSPEEIAQDTAFWEEQRLYHFTCVCGYDIDSRAGTHCKKCGKDNRDEIIRETEHREHLAVDVKKIKKVLSLSHGWAPGEIQDLTVEMESGEELSWYLSDASFVYKKIQDGNPGVLE